MCVLKTALESFFQKHSLFHEHQKFGIGISGGPDSLALAHSLIEFFPDKELYFFTVDHDLRESSEQEAQDMAAWIQSLKKDNLHHHILKWEGEKPKTAILEKARQVRYNLIFKFCEQNNIQNLFLGHHQDDQAETFLIRLAKGSGIDGLSSMRDISENDHNILLARPFLNLRKKNLTEYCDKYNLPYINDPTNENDSYLRPRLRSSMGILEGEGLSVERLSKTAKRLSRANKALENFVDQAQQDILHVQNNKIILNLQTYLSLEEEIALRLLSRSLEKFRIDAVYRVRMEKLEDLFEALWHDHQNFKPRTLGQSLIRIDHKKDELIIEDQP
ncbi:MAG: tRNA lysidine(34) synthetase TilS [Pseudomonadota bacterium]